MEVAKKAYETELLSHEAEIQKLREELKSYRKGVSVAQPTNAVGSRPLTSPSFAATKQLESGVGWSLFEFFFGSRHHRDEFDEILRV